MTKSKSISANKKTFLIILVSIVLIVVAVVVALYATGTVGKVRKKDYVINDRIYIEVTVNRKIGKIGNIGYILDDIVKNYSDYYQGGIYINDSSYCLSMSAKLDGDLYKSTQIAKIGGFYLGDVYENIGTTNKPKEAEKNNSKTRELNQYLEKYTEKYLEKHKENKQ